MTTLNLDAAQMAQSFDGATKIRTFRSAGRLHVGWDNGPHGFVAVLGDSGHWYVRFDCACLPGTTAQPFTIDELPAAVANRIRKGN
jgi:hypothetical protein